MQGGHYPRGSTDLSTGAESQLYPDLLWDPGGGISPTGPVGIVMSSRGASAESNEMTNPTVLCKCGMLPTATWKRGADGGRGPAQVS